MELLETADPDKKRLMDEVRKRRQQLDAEAGALARKSSKKLSNALMIAGVLVGSYLIYRAISKSRKTEKSKEAQTGLDKSAAPGSVSKSGNSMGSRLAQLAVVFLLNLARERVAAWLASRKQPHETA